MAQHQQRQQLPNRISITIKSHPSPTSSFIYAILLFLVSVLLSSRPVDSVPRGHGGGGNSKGDDAPSGSFYNAADFNDDYPTNKTTLNATEIAKLLPFTKTWPTVSNDDDDGPDQTSFPNPEYVR